MWQSKENVYSRIAHLDWIPQRRIGAQAIPVQNHESDLCSDFVTNSIFSLSGEQFRHNSASRKKLPLQPYEQWLSCTPGSARVDPLGYAVQRKSEDLEDEIVFLVIA
jgi:hypothetical protein